MMIDVSKLKKASIGGEKNKDKQYDSGDMGRGVLYIDDKRRIGGALAGWQDGMIIIKPFNPVDSVGGYLFVPAESCVWEAI